MTKNNNTGLQLTTIEDLGMFARAAKESGFFPDVKAAAAGVIKIQWGAELGIGPVTALTGIHNIKGKLAMSSTLISSLINRHPECHYEVVEMTDKAVELRCYRNGKPVGPSRFTIEDARTAGVLGNSTWTKYPRNMMMARAISNAARWYFADVFDGAPAYTAEELGGNEPEVDIALAEQIVESAQAASASEVYEAEVVEEAEWNPPDLGEDRDRVVSYLKALRQCDTEEELKATMQEHSASLQGLQGVGREIIRWEWNLALATAKGDQERLNKMNANEVAVLSWAQADALVEGTR